MRNFRILLAYDGTRYQGWQRQGNTDNTIQARLEAVLSRLLEQEVEVNGSGRTDAGAHASGQVASFHADTELPPDVILRRLRQHLPDDIGAISLAEAAPRFHARLNAREKTYVYRVWNSESPNIFERRYLYAMPRPLDLARMREAAEYFLGEHDFMALCANKHMKKSTVRTIRTITIERLGEEVRFTVTGDGFLYNMVRILVGTLLEIGEDEREPDCVPEILASRRRETAGETAPARGLCLTEVKY